MCEQDPQLMLKESWDCYYSHPDLQTKPESFGKPFTILSTHCETILVNCWATHFSQVTWPPHSGLAAHPFPHSSTGCMPHCPTSTHSHLFHLCSSQQPEGMEEKVLRKNPKPSNQILSPAYPLTSSYNAPATLETLLPQHFCICCPSSRKALPLGLSQNCHLCDIPVS